MGFSVAGATDDRTASDAPDSAGAPPVWRPRTFPVELLSLSGTDGHQVRVPLREFGPLLLAKVMDCSDVQESVLQVIWRLAEDEARPLFQGLDVQSMSQRLQLRLIETRHIGEDLRLLLQPPAADA